MSGDVASMPSLTRSGRPSFNFRSSSPSGSTLTASRVRSAAAIARSLVSGGLEILDLDRLDLVRRLEAEQLRREGERRLVRASDRVRTPETVAFALEADVRVGNTVPFERRGNRLCLRRRHNPVVEALEEQERLLDPVRVRHRRALAVELLLSRPRPDEVLVVSRLELVRVLVEGHEIRNAELGDSRREYVRDAHREQRRVATRA